MTKSVSCFCKRSLLMFLRQLSSHLSLPDVVCCFFLAGISLQEAIYGTKLLKRLEQIKEDIDPNYMFDCYGCIGNNRIKSVDEEEEKTDDSSSASSMLVTCCSYLIYVVCAAFGFAML